MVSEMLDDTIALLASSSCIHNLSRSLTAIVVVFRFLFLTFFPAELGRRLLSLRHLEMDGLQSVREMVQVPEELREAISEARKWRENRSNKGDEAFVQGWKNMRTLDGQDRASILKPFLVARSQGHPQAGWVVETIESCLIANTIAISLVDSLLSRSPQWLYRHGMLFALYFYTTPYIEQGFFNGPRKVNHVPYSLLGLSDHGLTAMTFYFRVVRQSRRSQLLAISAMERYLPLEILQHVFSYFSERDWARTIYIEMFLQTTGIWQHDLIREIALANPQHLKPIIDLSVIHHVGVFVVTNGGMLLVQKMKKYVQSFGGCNFANSLVRMVNSLRLELMDESSLLFSSPGFLRASPLVIMPHGRQATVLQVLLYDHKTLASASLWSAEHARKFFRKKVVPHGWTPAALVPSAVFEAGRVMQLIELSKARKMDDHQFRKCDRLAFMALSPIVDELLRGRMSNEAVLLPRVLGETSDSVMQDLERVVAGINLNEMSDLRAFMTSHPWRPLLWDDARILYGVKLFKLINCQDPTRLF